jgi:hypothetical protein
VAARPCYSWAILTSDRPGGDGRTWIWRSRITCSKVRRCRAASGLVEEEREAACKFGQGDGDLGPGAFSRPLLPGG